MDTPTHDPADDLVAIAAFRDGDPDAFDAVYRRYAPRIRALCQRYVGSGSAADDLVQETFYNLLRSVERIGGEGFNFSAWIHRIATNLCHDELRRRERSRSHVDPAGSQVDAAVLRLVDGDRAGHPEAAMELEELRQVVWQVARRLPERQQTVLTLRELQGLSYASIARLMGVSESAVETLLHRARRRFRDEYLADEGGGEPAGCAAATYLLDNLRNGSLRREQRRALALHLSDCAACRERFPQRAALALEEAPRRPPS